jgi:hypothetical protein
MSTAGAIHRFCSRHLGPWIRHPAVTLLTGVGLFASGIIELLEETLPDFEHFIGVHHGVILMGVVGILRGFAEAMEGAEWLTKEEGE